MKGTIAIRLIEHFKTVGAIFAASEKELQEVKGVGPQTAKDIRRVLEAEWD